MAIFLIANCQFGRASIIKKNKRPFESVHEMNEEMIQRWNTVVGDDDQVIHLGNFAWDPTTAEEVLGKLNGKSIMLLPGEDDAAILDMHSKGFLPSNASLTNRIYDQPALRATFSYWPMLEWPAKADDHYLYYGFYGPKYKPDHKKKMINMSCEFWNYTPHNLSTLTKLFKDKDFE